MADRERLGELDDLGADGIGGTDRGHHRLGCIQGTIEADDPVIEGEAALD